MGYRLKDRELQRKLDEISNGDFSRVLKNARFEFVDLQGADGKFVRVEFGRREIETESVYGVFSAIFRGWELEKAELYDPKKWNEWPTVEPPEGVWMRVVTSMGFGFKARFQFGDWLDNRNDIVGEKDGIDGEVCLFRPWEDPE